MHYEEQIAAFAAARHDVEACGLVLRDDAGDLVAIECPNVHPDPANYFAIEAGQWLAPKTAGRLVGYWHSHTGPDATPSDADRHVANEFGLPCWIYATEARRLNCYVPDGYRQPLEGRRFIPLVHDCISLVWDYYRDVMAIELPFLPRAQSDYAKGLPFDWRDFLEAVKPVQVTKPQPGDVLVMCIAGSSKPNHLGVYVGDGIMIHQRNDYPSERTVWGGYWEKNTTAIFRHPNTPSAAMTPESEHKAEKRLLNTPVTTPQP